MRDVVVCAAFSGPQHPQSAAKAPIPVSEREETKCSFNGGHGGSEKMLHFQV